MIKPIFIFSLPRSGSTLLQRMLTVHDDIASTAEPWILLPLFYGFKSNGIYTEYAQFGAHVAIQDVVSNLPQGEKDLYEAVRLYAYHIYTKLAEEKGAQMFVDKTPRYHLIADEIIQAFPDAKFIFLWRNPISIVSSIVDTWDGKYWSAFKYKVDLYKGIASLLNAFEGNKDKALSVNYEELLRQPEKCIKEICAYVGVDYQSEMLDSLASARLKGRLGDPTGVSQYQKLSLAPISKWKDTVCNPYRKHWCKKYVQWLGEERMAVMGYHREDELKALDRHKVSRKYLLGDLLMQPYGMVYCVFEFRLFRDKLKKTWKAVVFHG